VLRFTVLGSGSTGNATLIEGHDGGVGGKRPTRLLVDCGFTYKETKLRLARRGLEVDDIDAVFVTHEHGDHLGCIGTLVRKHGLPVWTSAGTWAGGGMRTAGLTPPPHFARDGQTITVGALELRPFAVPHDALEPLQLVVGDGQRRLGVATDLGTLDASVIEALQGCEALLLESNHDEHMLASGPYPWSLRRRIAGHLGHLGNRQARDLLRACMHLGLKRVVAAHLSLHNNTPALAVAGLADEMGWRPRDIDVADAVTGTDWIEV
jgi:phosphoribosyl 1,2-cyclic phosphodiesterase